MHETFSLFLYYYFFYSSIQLQVSLDGNYIVVSLAYQLMYRFSRSRLRLPLHYCYLAAIFQSVWVCHCSKLIDFIAEAQRNSLLTYLLLVGAWRLPPSTRTTLRPKTRLSFQLEFFSLHSITKHIRSTLIMYYFHKYIQKPATKWTYEFFAQELSSTAETSVSYFIQHSNWLTVVSANNFRISMHANIETIEYSHDNKILNILLSK